MNGKGEPDDDFDYGALIEEEEKPKEKKPRGRGRAPRVPATVSFDYSKSLVSRLTIVNMYNRLSIPLKRRKSTTMTTMKAPRKKAKNGEKLILRKNL